jgi:hypothetical protein
MSIQLAVRATKVLVDGTRRDLKPSSDRAGHESLSHQSEHVDLARAESGIRRATVVSERSGGLMFRNLHKPTQWIPQPSKDLYVQLIEIVMSCKDHEAHASGRALDRYLC